MKIITGSPLVVMRWDELEKLLLEIPVEKIVEMDWFKWEMGSDWKKYATLSHRELLNKIFIELEDQAG